MHWHSRSPRRTSSRVGVYRGNFRRENALCDFSLSEILRAYRRCASLQQSSQFGLGAPMRSSNNLLVSQYDLTTTVEQTSLKIKLFYLQANLIIKPISCKSNNLPASINLKARPTRDANSVKMSFPLDEQPLSWDHVSGLFSKLMKAWVLSGNIWEINYM